MTVHLSRGATLAAALMSLVAIALPLTAGAQGPATAQWATYLGGSATDRINTVTQLSGGDVVVVGTTSSQSLAPSAPLDPPRSSGQDIFVAYFDSDGRTIPEFPFLVFGGTGIDEVTAAALGPNNEVYIVGRTTSNTASITGVGNVFRSSLSGDNAFLARISATGTADWFLFLSGTGDDVATGVTVSGNNVYVSGWTTSVDFLGRVGTTPAGVNGFVVRVEPTSTTATIGWQGTPQIIGASGTDTLRGITAGMVDGEAKLMAVGTTDSNPLRPDKATNDPLGGQDAFVVRLNVDDGALERLTFLGGSGSDEGNAIASDLGSSFVVAGTTLSAIGGGTPPPAKDAFVAWLNGEGMARLIQVRGGTGIDEALTVTTDSYGTAYVGGRTSSSDFPVSAGVFDSTIESGSGVREGFVWAASPEGGDGWASFLGSAGTMDEVKSLSLRASNRLIVGLDTDSSAGLPGTFTYDSTSSTPLDGYILSVAVNDPTPPSPVGEVFDRLQQDTTHEDEEETPSTTSIFANWTEFTDANTGITKYEWAIGTQQNPTAIMPFTSVGLQLSAGATGLTLTPGQRYIVTVRAQNGYGLTAIARSNGITVLGPPPPDGGPDGGVDGGTDGGTGGTDGGTDGGTGGTDGGTGGPDGGDGGGPGEEPTKPESPLGWGCASAGGAAPLFLGLVALMLLRRRLGQR